MNFGLSGSIGGAATATGSGQMSKSDQASAQMQTSFDNAIASANQTLRVSTDGQAALNALRARPN